ncbi:MAG TPA: hypothetical protein VFS40_14635, partial [Gemmatimonadales bacterium]|nr:hypothetical protein [Gemmatimonadales bacterium]
RGRLAYERARLTGADPLKEGLIAQGLDYANQALQRDARDPDALELRGTLRYWRYLLGLERDDVVQRQLVADAKADLLAAVKQSPNQAEALRLLAHLYARVENDDVNAKEYAERAYAADAYLRSVDEILGRLFFTSYDLERFADARHWCDEGVRRFPREPIILECRLWLMTMKAGRPDPAHARALADTLVALAPPARQSFQRLYERMVVAAVLARAGQPDSARRLARASRGDAEVDPTRDLLLTDAFVHTLVGDTTEALRSLRLYLAANPDRRAAMADDPGWWFRPISNDPRFRRLVDAQP